MLCLNLFLSALVARDHAPATRKGKVSYAASGDYAEALCAASLLNLVYDRALRLLATSPCVARGGACYDVCCLCRDCCADLGKLGLYVALLASCAVAVGAGKERDIPDFKGSDLGRFPLGSADFWTSDHPLERSRSVDAFF